MLTPQEVSSKAFDKAVRGYSMVMVDEFLDELTEDYTALYKENAALKTKLKVMVDKVEEYRSTEDAMRAALLAAQKMAEGLVAEAEQKKADTLKGVDAAVAQRRSELEQEIYMETQRLINLKKEVTSFVDRSRVLCQGTMASLERISKENLVIPPSLPQPQEQKAKQTADEIEASIFSTLQEKLSVPNPETPAAGSDAPRGEAPAAEAAPARSAKDSILEDFQNSRRLNVSELKFGRNVSSGKA